ncbi:vWA domain-containing protein [Desulfovirgula thermocuniculi]|uniref:vWA domain-containing protein n=1 Tax=Desulfovirgula thermocuniculi TaxID=348842 RepID=UPI0004873D8D|nr:vWA domain-containing protein [Desulfovirgula thermocuniculi]
MSEREAFVDACWEEAKKPWGFVQLRRPVVYWDPEAARQAMGTQLAFFNFVEKNTLVNYPALEARGAGEYLVELLSHEIGHHMAIPADPPSDALLLHAAYRGLGLYELPEDDERLARGHREAVFWVNLFADVIVNTVLYRAGLRMVPFYQKLTAGEGSPLWRLYLRTLELLWELPPETLASALSTRLERDARRLAEVFRHLRGKRDWPEGMALFARICHPYWPAGEGPWLSLLDYQGRANYRRGGRPGSDPGQGGSQHPGPRGPAPVREGPSRRRTLDKREERPEEEGPGGLAEHIDSPADYRRLLRGLGFAAAEEAEVRYYRDLARRFAVRPASAEGQKGEEHPEAAARWEPGDPPEELDLLATLTTGGVILPGITTLRRESVTAAARGRGREAPWLVLALDASGSMPNPKRKRSYAVLAAFILAEAAFDAGAPVAAVVFSGDYESTGFTREREAVASLLVRYPGRDTYFPAAEVLRLCRAAPRPPYLCVISDAALHNAGEALEGLAQAARATCGGTLYFIYHPRRTPPPDIQRLLEKVSALGYRVCAVTGEEDLQRLSLATARELYGQE